MSETQQHQHNAWQTVIGLEVHVQLNTAAKIFSGAATNYGATANSQACAIDLGLPGVLPIVNQDVIKKAVKFGLAIQAEICQTSVFARKNYFYPDLPKGYQISQYEQPIVGQGHLDIITPNNSEKQISIIRAHLEEDAGKSLHANYPNRSGIDLNRAGTPLLEVVSAPELANADEAVAYLKTLHSLVRYLDICDGNMQEGSFRCDVNVSVRRKQTDPLGTRVELKNINSFRFVEKAILFETERQIGLLETGGQIIQETRLYDANRDETRTMRRKEEANDYRYFPDPDLLPIVLSDEFIAEIREQLPELPKAKRERFQREYKLNVYDASILTANKACASFFETVVSTSKVEPKLVANWINGELSAALNKNNLDFEQSPIVATQFAILLTRISEGVISGKIAKTVFEHLWQGADGVDEIITKHNLRQVTDSGAIEAIIDQVLAAHPVQLASYRAGKDKLYGFFVGQVMQASQGKAKPQQVNALLKQKLDGDA